MKFVPDLRFDGRVAVVTGGGRGLGRSYALLLASHGAKVVVNDPGGNLSGDGTDAGPAEQVVREITAAGGEAAASTDSVATPAGGTAIIDTALDRYGRIDILVHNAGIVRQRLVEGDVLRRLRGRSRRPPAWRIPCRAARVPV